MIGFLDCYSGVSGDMLLGALVDVGVPLDHLQAVVRQLPTIGDVRLVAEDVQRAGIRATKVTVVAGEQEPRTLPQILTMLESSPLDTAVLDASCRVLRRIAEVEGRLHGEEPDAVELHEVGATDSIVDIVGTTAGLAYLGLDRLYVSALPVSPGSIAATAHGPLPAPAPATLELLAEVAAPTRPFGEGRELVTPTGAALTSTLGRFEQPPMVVRRVGYGAGSAELPWPNVLRLWLGDERAPSTPPEMTEHVVLESNIDDMNPQLLAAVPSALFAAGALDVSMTPLQMKKGRSGTLVSVIARRDDEDVLAGVLLRETTTLGVRVHAVWRHEAERRSETIETRYGLVQVKLKLLDGRVVGATPEFESVRQLAESVGAPTQAVHAAAAAAADRKVSGG